MMAKSCLVAGCTGNPSFGWGLPSWRSGIRWACRNHKSLLNAAVTGASVAAVQVASQRGGDLPVAGSPSIPAPRQGSLL